MYFTGLSEARFIMAKSPYFAMAPTSHTDGNKNGSTLAKLNSKGNLIAGAVTRVTVGFMLNPFSVLKARFEVSGIQAKTCDLPDYH